MQETLRHTSAPDLPTTTTWCDNAATSYRFDAKGGFVMQQATGKTWGGNWFYRQPLTDVEINLRHGQITGFSLFGYGLRNGQPPG